MNGRNQVRFSDGSQVKHSEECNLGGILTRNVNIAAEITSRIASATATWRSLDMVWKEACCSLRSKLLQYPDNTSSKANRLDWTYS